MNMFSKNQITKKFILILVLLMLFNFVLPPNIKADEVFGGTTIKDSAGTYSYETSNPSKEGGFFDIGTNFTKLLFLGERAIIGFLNNIFCDDQHQFLYGIKGEDIVVENLNLTPENIIKGSFVLFDADIFKNIADTSSYFDAGKTGTVNGKMELRNTVAGWYYALRNFAIVALLSVLVYVGIRMITSTISQDKAKYKVMLKDWFVALCLVVVMHYIMITILNLSSMITDAIAGPGGSASSQTAVLMQKIGTITEADKSYTVTYDGKAHDDIRAIMVDNDGKLEFYDIGNALAFMLLLLVIIFYTGLFAVKYLKREFTIIFLILLAPISAVTYPIDKIADGKAQAFNKWFYEFLYNVIIQPFHLLIYIVLVGSATQLADDNILYSIICFAVMIPAEKFVKEMFGFRDKLGAPLGGFAGGALASQLFNKMKGGGSSGKSGKEEENNSTPNPLPPRTIEPENLTDGGNSTDQTSITQGRQNEQLDNTTDNGLSGPSAADANNGVSSEDPVDRMEREDLEEKIADGQIDENDLDENQRALLGIDNNDENSPSDDDSSNNSEEENNDKENIAKRIWNSKPVGTIRAVHNERMSKKWGSTSRGKRWVNRGKKFGIGALKKAGRIATTGAGALAGGTLSFMMGQGFGKGALTGGALGNTLYKKGEKAIGNAVETGKDYTNALKNDKGKENQAFTEFRANKKQIDNAVNSFRKNNDGKDPTRKELQKEIRDRFELSRYGLDDQQIDDCLPLYQDKLEELMENPDVDEDKAKEIAASQAKYTANLAKTYSPKDFRDAKVMSSACEKIKTGLMENTGCSDAIAEEYTRSYLTNAGKMKSVMEKEIALPDGVIKVGKIAPKSEASTEMKIKVKEGRTKIEHTGEQTPSKVVASVDFVENPENQREFEKITSEESTTREGTHIEVSDSEASKKIERIKQSRSKSLSRETSKKKDERVERLELEDKVSGDLGVKSTEENIKRKANEIPNETN